LSTLLHWPWGWGKHVREYRRSLRQRYSHSGSSPEHLPRCNLFSPYLSRPARTSRQLNFHSALTIPSSLGSRNMAQDIVDMLATASRPVICFATPCRTPPIKKGQPGIGQHVYASLQSVSRITRLMEPADATGTCACILFAIFIITYLFGPIHST